MPAGRPHLPPQFRPSALQFKGLQPTDADEGGPRETARYSDPGGNLASLN